MNLFGLPPVDFLAVTSLPYATEALMKALGGGEKKGEIGQSAILEVSTQVFRGLIVEAPTVGTVAAASAVTVGLHLCAPRTVVAFGTSGALASSVDILDVVVGDTYTNGSANASAFTWEAGQVPGNKRRFEGDRELLEAASLYNTTSAAVARVVIGELLTTDTFITGANIDSALALFPRVIAADMESAAVAQVALAYGRTFIAVRGVSDVCGTNARDQFRENMFDAAAFAGKVLASILATSVAGSHRE